MERLSPRDASRREPVLATGLDPQSRLVLLSFAIQCAALAVIALGFGGSAPLGMFILLTALAGQCNSFAALLSGHPFGRGPLNRWDVGMMHFAVSVGARLLQ